MKPIQPISIWVNGQSEQANYLACYSSYDNLSSAATFKYTLYKTQKDSDNNIINTWSLADGELTMSGTDYDTWGQSQDINNDAYIWVANQLNLTLV